MLRATACAQVFNHGTFIPSAVRPPGVPLFLVCAYFEVRSTVVQCTVLYPFVPLIAEISETVERQNVK